MNEAVLVIDKEPGPTSFDIVRQVKNLFPRQKIGHAGSLDPFASGVLVLLMGKATKLSGLLLNADKRYWARVKLGEATDTMDRTGEVVVRQPVTHFSESKVFDVLKSFEGEWMQVPPMYSAKKVRGVRLYELARHQVNVRLSPIPVQIYSIAMERFESPFVDFVVECSKGTYVRSLADEFGKRLGTVAHLSELRRTRCGEFSIEEAISLKELAGNLSYLRKGYENFLRLLKSGLAWRGISRQSEFANANQ